MATNSRILAWRIPWGCKESDVTGDRRKVRCCKEQYGIGTWNVRSMNQGKLEVVKQEMARVNSLQTVTAAMKLKDA